jgi:hypothetical protein
MKLGLLIASLSVGVGCAISGQSRVENLTSGLDDDVVAVVLDLDAGDVYAERTDGDAEFTQGILWSDVARPIVEESTVDHVHTVTVRCPTDAPADQCRVDYDLLLPDGVALTVTTGDGVVDLFGIGGSSLVTVGNGDVRVRDVIGGVSVASSMGDVVVSGTSGRVQVVAENGNVWATGLRATAVNVMATQGAIDVGCVQLTESLDAVSQTGSITIELPDQAYDVDVYSELGETSIGVQTSDTAEVRVVATTVEGDIDITVRDEQ